jgi:hypothetical protein
LFRKNGAEGPACNGLAQYLSQQPRTFDFPRQHLPPQFHYTGPWHDRSARPPVPFPYENLRGKAMIYASIGTLQNRIELRSHPPWPMKAVYDTVYLPHILALAESLEGRVPAVAYSDIKTAHDLSPYFRGSENSEKRLRTT